MMINQYIHRDAAVGIEFLSHVLFDFDSPGKEHTHAQTQYLAVIRGSTDIRIGLHVSQLHAGDIAVLKPGDPHTVPATAEAQTVELLDLRIRNDGRSELATFVRSRSHRPITRVSLHDLKRLAQQLSTATTRPAADHRAAVMAGVWSLLALIGAASDQPPESAMERRIAVAERFMLEHLRDPVSSTDIADACALSVSQLNRLYRAHVGLGPAERLRAIRVARAQELLVSSLMSVKEIAFDCGFVCPNHFCRVFKSEVGLTPGDYRDRGGAPVRA